MYETPAKAMARIKELNYPSVFQKIWEREIPADLRASIDRPAQFFDAYPELADVFPDIQSYLPLWEINCEAIVALDEAHKEYVRYYYGDDRSERLGSGYQRLISSLFLDLASSGLVEELREFSGLFEYKYIDSLLAFVKGDFGEDRGVARKKWLDSILD